MAFCPHCGNAISDGATFCGYCGSNLTQTQKQAQPSAPTFSPPTAPTFTPPARTFTPPVRANNGPVCYYHKDEPAVAKCVRCGKYICQDCFDSYGFENDDQYGNEALCYDCTKQLVADNVRDLKKQKAKIWVLFIATLIGMAIGAAFFSESTLAGFVCMFWFGSFWAWLKNTFSTWWNAPEGRTFAGFIGAGIGGLIIAPFLTISKIIRCIVYLSRTSKSIKSDQESLARITDYMEYTMVRNENRGVDIETLLQQNSQLANNSVAQMAKTMTEEQIEANMRGCVATINENGEIIRNFAA